MWFPYLRLKEVGKTVEENEGGFVDKCSGPFLFLCQGYSYHSCHIQKQHSIIHLTNTAVGKVSVSLTIISKKNKRHYTVITVIIFLDLADRLLYG